VSRAVLAGLIGLLLLPAAAGAVTNGDRDVRILGGGIAAPGQFPFMALLMDSAAKRAVNGAFCGGTVIAPRVVLTAGHCVIGARADEIDVVIGRTRLSQDADGERIKVSQIVLHPNYDNRFLVNDIALLQLATPTAWPAMPIARPADNGLTAPGSRVMVIGWGATQEGGGVSDELRFVRLTARSHGYCDRVYGPINDASQLCAGSSRAGEDACQGDSGGPVVAGDGTAIRVVGTVSYGDGCGRQGIPGVYTRVSRFAGWLDENVPFLNGDAAQPQTPENPPVVRIGKITCAAVYCDVYLRTTGRAPGGGIVLNVVRKRSPGKKKIDSIAFAKQLSKTRWKVHVFLPYGNLTLYAIPLTEAFDDLDGDGDVVQVRSF
jgi:secreted trypsin-like serine protease